MPVRALEDGSLTSRGSPYTNSDISHLKYIHAWYRRKGNNFIYGGDILPENPNKNKGKIYPTTSPIYMTDKKWTLVSYIIFTSLSGFCSENGEIRLTKRGIIEGRWAAIVRPWTCHLLTAGQTPRCTDLCDDLTSRYASIDVSFSEIIYITAEANPFGAYTTRLEMTGIIQSTPIITKRIITSHHYTDRNSGTRLPVPNELSYW